MYAFWWPQPDAICFTRIDRRTGQTPNSAVWPKCGPARVKVRIGVGVRVSSGLQLAGSSLWAVPGRILGGTTKFGGQEGGLTSDRWTPAFGRGDKYCTVGPRSVQISVFNGVA